MDKSRNRAAVRENLRQLVGYELRLLGGGEMTVVGEEPHYTPGQGLFLRGWIKREDLRAVAERLRTIADTVDALEAE